MFAKKAPMVLSHTQEKTLRQVTSIEALRKEVALFHAKKKKVGFVPTMGALHAGHLSLIDTAKKQADIVVVSIFVNPTQFGANEDFSVYPRQLEKDISLLKEKEIDLLYQPSVETMYPPGFSTSVSVGPVSKGLCSDTRPTFFDGVALIVAKLLNQVQPDVAVFGEKDFQQLCVIQRLVTDLDLPVKIVGAPTIREDDGLAMSSRNAYLDEEQRRIAPELYAVLKEISGMLATTDPSIDELIAWGERELLERGFDSIDYLTVCDAKSLKEVNDTKRPVRVFGAAYLGETRLIDNVAVKHKS